MAAQKIVMTWFYAESVGEESFYPQVAELSSSMKFQEVYWRCAAGLFATSKRVDPDYRRIFFTNVPKDSLPIIDGRRMGDLFKELGVEVINLPLVYQTPDGFFHEWRSQFYIFGIFKYLLENGFADEDQCILLDSDCVFTKSLEPMFTDLEKSGVMMYEIPYAENHRAHGLTRLDMKDIYSEMLDKPMDHTPRYFGGEVQAFCLKDMRVLMNDYDWVWETSLERNKQGKKKFTMEAFVLSFLYYKHNYTDDRLDKYIRRIWTVDHHYTAKPTDLALHIWHLPSEKKFGFFKLYQDIIRKDSRFWKAALGQEWVSYLAGIMEIPHRSAFRLVKANLRTVKNRVLDLVKK